MIRSPNAGAPTITTNLHLGGRFESLQTADGFEWLWTNPRTIRTPAEPGDPFIDAGGVEECFPTLAGLPDHGDVWTRQWVAIDARTAFCATPDARLIRTVESDDSGVRLGYTLHAEPGYRFVWAFHALLVPDPGLVFDISPGETVLSWISGFEQPPEQSTWPRAGYIDRFDDVSSDDGTACFALLPDRSRIEMRVGPRSLAMALNAPGAPSAIAIWRNLKGFAADGGEPYRSIGVEPMLGRNPYLDPDPSCAADQAVVPSSGTMEWSLSLTLDGAMNPAAG